MEEEKSLMEDVLNGQEEPKGSKLQDDYKEPVATIGEYKRKYSFENVIYSLTKKDRAEIAKLITDNEREKFLNIVLKINTQLEYYQLFDKEYDILLKKQGNLELETNAILKEVEMELKQFDKIIRFIMLSLNDWLNIKGYLAKELSVQDWGNYTATAYKQYGEETENNAVKKIQELRKSSEEKIIKTNYLFFEYYDTFIKDKPLQ